MSTYPDEYQEHVLNAPDVCSSCFSIVRVEREIPARGWHAAETYYARNEQTTSVEHVQAETVSETEQVFCECGVASAFDRVWADRDMDRSRFRAMLKRLMHSVERKGLTINRQRMAAHALQAYGRQHTTDDDVQVRIVTDVDAALAQGLNVGLRAAVTSPSASTA
jgi:hypothetical protein